MLTCMAVFNCIFILQPGLFDATVRHGVILLCEDYSQNDQKGVVISEETLFQRLKKIRPERVMPRPYYVSESNAYWKLARAPTMMVVSE